MADKDKESKNGIRCHYEVLGVEQNSDDRSIKKAYHKLAVKYHPDKTGGDEESTAFFRLIQQAYECLSDPAERQWYDEHREVILRGGTGDTDDEDQFSSRFVFDVVPYQHPFCYSGFGDGEGGFFAVYSFVFESIVKGEREGWQSVHGNRGNSDTADDDENSDDNDDNNESTTSRGLTNRLLPTEFGTGDTAWETVSFFYAAWESFSSCLSFAWVDRYDTREAPNRRVRRAMEEENRKCRRAARRQRNDQVLGLVRFVKRRDPRVKAARERAEQERIAKQNELQETAEKRRKEAAIAKQEWRREAALAMAQAEEEDLNAGRVRLADLEDEEDDDDYGGGKARGKKKKKKKKRGKKKVARANSDDDDLPDDDEEEENDETNDNAKLSGETWKELEEDDRVPLHEAEQDAKEKRRNSENEDSFNDAQGCVLVDKEEEEEEEDDEDEDEPNIWRCECCRKDFRSEQQLENHFKSKKHREAWKKYQKTLQQTKRKQEKEKFAMDELLNDMVEQEVVAQQEND